MRVKAGPDGRAKAGGRLSRELARAHARVRASGLRGGGVLVSGGVSRSCLHPWTTASLFDLPDGPRGEKLSMERWAVEGDGSCFFHAFCLANDVKGYRRAYTERNVARCKEIAYEFRCSFGSLDEARYRSFLDSEAAFTPNASSMQSWIEEEREHSKDELRERACNPRTWANEAMIRLASRLLNKNVVALDLSKGSLFCGVHGRSDLEMVFIVWVERMHFELGVLRIDYGGRTEHRLTLRPDNPLERGVIDFIMSQYDDSCPCVRSQSRSCSVKDEKRSAPRLTLPPPRRV